MQFEEQVSFLAKLKLNSGLAKSCKICITCWELIVLSESAVAHKDHVITGTFDQMQAATTKTLTGLCQAKGRYKSGLHNQVVQLFFMSKHFQTLNSAILDEIVQAKMLRLLP